MLIGELDHDHDLRGYCLRGVRATSCIVRGDTRRNVRRQACVVPTPVSTASEDIATVDNIRVITEERRLVGPPGIEPGTP